MQAAHGATVGQLDERSLFYLRSRGIPLAEARAMLTAAFCRAVLGDLPNEALREHLSALLIAQLPAYMHRTCRSVKPRTSSFPLSRE
ncbi:hypothetical protein RLIN73S_02886 [Rhodanobacter lindaniclasticus]